MGGCAFLELHADKDAMERHVPAETAEFDHDCWVGTKYAIKVGI